jgi:hypothetical protein
VIFILAWSRVNVIASIRLSVSLPRTHLASPFMKKHTAMSYDSMRRTTLCLSITRRVRRGDQATVCLCGTSKAKPQNYSVPAAWKPTANLDVGNFF